MNVLFFIVDDLRTQLGCYGGEGMSTPNIDRLAASGTLFERAYSAFPICGPSRASTLTGLRPAPARFFKWNASVDEDVPGALTIPEHFKNLGYHTRCIGKTLHNENDCARAWSGGVWMPPGGIGAVPGAYAISENRERKINEGRAPAFEEADVDDDAYGDGQGAALAVQELRELAAGKQPFFLSVGFVRPHLPFNAPRRYWDIYDRDAIKLPENSSLPENAPDLAATNWQELRNYAGIPAEGPLDDDLARTLIHGYNAGVSYMDAQLGRVVDELERLGLRGDTAVLLCADHGWQLGEHGLWSKHCLFEESLHCPLIVSGPGVERGRAAGLAEFVDIFPSLCELADLPLPAHLHGRSFVPQLRDARAPGKDAVFSRHGNQESVKTDRHRYSEWTDAEGSVIARMLYDHALDPGENFNIAGSPAHAAAVAGLAGVLRENARATA